MALRMRRPETVRLDMGDGDWLLVKKHLTAGEQRAVFRRMMREAGDKERLDPVRVGWSKIVGYLLDWSVKDTEDKPVVILDKTEDELGAALDALDVESFAAILKAVEAHEEAMEKERGAEKARPTTEIAS